MKKHPKIVHDPLIIPRVKQYLEENVHQTYVDVSVMARQLQERYREYNRRKSGPFRQLVQQAYKTVLHSYGLDSNPSSETENSEVEMMDDNSNSNHMNNMLTNLYDKVTTNKRGLNNSAQPAAGGNNNEAIDISSDDGENAPNANGGNISKNENEPPKVPRTITLSKIGYPPKDLQYPLSLKPGLSVADPQAKQSTTATATTDKPAQVMYLNQQQFLMQHGLQQQLALQNQTHGIKKRKLNDLQANVAGKHQIPSQNVQQTPTQHQPNKNNITKQKISLISGGENGTFGSQRGFKKFKKGILPESSQYTFQSIGGIDRVLKELCEILFHYKNPQIYHKIGMTPPRGLLLHGPPGCGKSMLAQAVAGTLDIPVLNVPATELIAGVSGESEERIRDTFEQAAMFAPCVLFIDEIDAISSSRVNAQKDMERRIVSQLISSLDSLDNFENGDLVLVIGATNRPDVLDPALRRIGRFDHEISLGIPDRKEREEILRVISEKLQLEANFDFDKIAQITPGYVGADLMALCFSASSMAVKRKYIHQMRIRQAVNEKYIPIVDLDDGSEEHDKIKTQVTENNKENSSEKTTDNSNTEIEATDATTKEAEKTTAENNSDISMEIEKTDEKCNEKDDVSIKENEKIETDDCAEKTTDESSKSMSPKKPTTEENDSNKSNESKVSADISAETIDLEVIPDVIQDDTLSTDQIISRTKKNPSLLEMLNWLTNDFTISESDLQDVFVTMKDFEDAVKVVQPSAKREGFITVPDVTWDDIGSLQSIREELQLSVLAPVKFPEKMIALGLTAPSGILLCGPPGCGKTLLAKAIANEAGINFISIKGPELMNMYVGESERAVRTCFQRARNSAPCVIFFDEFDSLCPKRSESNESGSGTRIVNQLLTEMDGIEGRKGVYLLAATNRPDIIDPAILRPGRLETVLYVGLPEENDREEILGTLTKNRTNPVLHSDVDLVEISQLTKGFTGADLAGLLRQASFLSLKSSFEDPNIKTEDLCVTKKNFMDALKLVKPSVSLEDRKVYDNLKTKYAAPRDSKESSKKN